MREGATLIEVPVERVNDRVVITEAAGLNVRIAARIALAVMRFTSRVTLTHGSGAADARRVLDVLTLRCERGTVLEIEAVGSDADLCCIAIRRAIRSLASEGDLRVRPS